ncbi:MAG: response regulator [Gammaproteobacteria bacterium]|nr:response regulator [Gammaproteobacteria bacterium]MDH5693651.1 response regulator [Gammaproteobacteria bacterium]
MSKNILIVDDSMSLRQVVSIALTGAGYNVIEAGDGNEALTKLNGDKIHLIVSDVNMPGMDGITFVSHVKQDANYKFTPIIMLTTESQQEMIQKGKELGVKAWLVKPFKPEQMLDAVSKLILP